MERIVLVPSLYQNGNEYNIEAVNTLSEDFDEILRFPNEEESSEMRGNDLICGKPVDCCHYVNQRTKISQSSHVITIITTLYILSIERTNRGQIGRAHV